MKINIYYGGRGIMGDPTLYVLSKMQKVLEELNVKIERFNLYDEKKNIPSLPSSLNDADGVVLASTVEWYGIGGYMSEFLDSCWFYGNKTKIAEIYMCPVVMSTTYGEREGLMRLQAAWDMLGGKPCNGISGYVKDSVSFELNKAYSDQIEKTAENMYRSISRKAVMFPASNRAVTEMVSAPKQIDLTPQETEQLSKYASDEIYVQTQKEDIKELASHFKTLLQNNGVSEEDMLIDVLNKNFHAQKDFNASYKFDIKEFNKPLMTEIKGGELKMEYSDRGREMVLCKLDKDVMDQITKGATSFQHAFMSGSMKVKGDFALLRMLDKLFVFSSAEG